MKRTYLLYFILLTFCCICFSHNLWAMEASPRRLAPHPSPQAYLDAFPDGQKTLVIGAGFAYDDLVVGSKNRFIGEIEVEKTRLRYYPQNAYLTTRVMD